ncbi:MAG: bifunctional adenosylcobinamide kinase/adenosylcobinamide-phosphate guanylyltransferase [Clostridiaceae bacterium]|nr:bifunctional adenosylcobinamide kinase/adenosylcobinamide-phosphate guanylyltransferase [Clostridiaceae bacterium]
MLILVTGGAASGKSEHAEHLLCEAAPPGERLYVAAMQPYGEAAQRRIARHRALRAGKGFADAERYTDLAHFSTGRRFEGILLECLSNLLANEMFQEDCTDAVQAVLSGVDALEAQCGTLVVVTNEIFSDGNAYPAETRQYIRALAAINQALAARADAVYESVCGILCRIKG